MLSVELIDGVDLILADVLRGYGLDEDRKAAIRADVAGALTGWQPPTQADAPADADALRSVGAVGAGGETGGQRKLPRSLGAGRGPADMSQREGFTVSVEVVGRVLRACEWVRAAQVSGADAPALMRGRAGVAVLLDVVPALLEGLGPSWGGWPEALERAYAREGALLGELQYAWADRNGLRSLARGLEERLGVVVVLLAPLCDTSDDNSVLATTAQHVAGGAVTPEAALEGLGPEWADALVALHEVRGS